MKRFTLFVMSLFLTLGVMAQVTALADFKADKSYTVSTTTRGSWAVKSTDNGYVFCSAKEAGEDVTAEQQQFAVLSANDGADYYLYSVAAKQFVKADKTVSSATVAPDAIEINAAGEGRIQVYFKDYTLKYVNLNGAQNLSVDTWTTIDDGNAVQFVEAADFDAAAALDYLQNVVKLTFEYYKGGSKVETEIKPMIKGVTYTVEPKPFQSVKSVKLGENEVAPVDGVYSFVVNEAATVKVTVESSYPFTLTTDDAAPALYAIKSGRGDDY